MLPEELFLRHEASVFIVFLADVGDSGDTLMLATKLLLDTLFHSASLPFKSKVDGLSTVGVTDFLKQQAQMNKLRI